MLWGNLIHLSFNMWGDHKPTLDRPVAPWIPVSSKLQCGQSAWTTITDCMIARGLNLVVIDVGDGVQFESHPEIAVDGAWTPRQLHDEVKRMNAHGVEAIPKFNFSASHDAWLKGYSRMVSTGRYYRVCADLIQEAVEIFDYPRLFHLGMDEETAGHQKDSDHVTVRMGDLWWHDLHFYLDQVERRGAQGWVWADHAWRNPDEYLKRMPRSVVQSNWYYADTFDPEELKGRHPALPAMASAFSMLQSHGFEQIPCGSTWGREENFPRLVDHCLDQLDDDLLKGFLMTTWLPTVDDFTSEITDAIDIVGRVASRPPVRGSADSLMAVRDDSDDSGR